MRSLKFLVGVALVMGSAGFVYLGLRGWEVRRLTAQVEDLKRDRERLVEYIQRLSANHRVAQVDVLQQYPDERGRTVSVIRWHEIGLDGTLGEPQTIEAVGRLVYFEAAVIKFTHEFVGKGDPEKGTSLALFRRIFGEEQAAVSVPELDRAARAPSPGEGRPSEFQQRLWDLFWDLIDDPVLAERFGVRIAQVEAPAVPLRAGQIWEVTLDTVGGINLRLVAQRSLGGDLPGSIASLRS